MSMVASTRWVVDRYLKLELVALCRWVARSGQIVREGRIRRAQEGGLSDLRSGR
jgi:hypothetical protein